MSSVRTRSIAKKQQTLQQKCEGLFQAVRDRNIDKARSFLEAGAKADYISLSGNMMFSTFHAALPQYENNQKDEEESKQHTDLLNILIDKKYTKRIQDINIMSPDSYGINPFEWAIADGKANTTRWFLQFINKHQPHIALEIINRQNHLPTLIGEKCKRIKNQSPIQLAVKSESLETIQALCSNVPRPNVGQINGNHQNAMHLAIHSHLPYILYELVNIASVNDIETVNENGQTSMQYAQYCYEESLTNVALPSDILRAWQCKEVLKARLEHRLRERWEAIKAQREPTHNAVIAFWKFNEEKNPNTNALKAATIPKSCFNIIHEDIDKVIGIDKEKYRKVSFEEACALQHQNARWMTTHRGVLDVNERYIYKQKLSPFTQQYKALLCKRREQLGLSIATESEYIECKAVVGKTNKKALSPQVFEYENEWIKVEALNKELDKELTVNDRIVFYEYSIGKYKSNAKVEIREILDRCHPCKRHNMDEPVFGLFAAMDLPKKTIIGEYTGLMCTSDEYSAQIGHFERFDGQFRTYKFESLDPHHNGYQHNKFMVNGSYFSNECVFVNDSTKDDVFGKWNIPNISFFEIRINEWPHTFLRAFNDIEKGEECFTDYGINFWRSFNNDRQTSDELNKYYLHRLERNKTCTNRKRKRRNVDDEVMVKKRKMNTNTNNTNNTNSTKMKIISNLMDVDQDNDTDVNSNDIEIALFGIAIGKHQDFWNCKDDERKPQIIMNKHTNAIQIKLKSVCKGHYVSVSFKTSDIESLYIPEHPSLFEFNELNINIDEVEENGVKVVPYLQVVFIKTKEQLSTYPWLSQYYNPHNREKIGIERITLMMGMDEYLSFKALVMDKTFVCDLRNVVSNVDDDKKRLWLNNLRYGRGIHRAWKRYDAERTNSIIQRDMDTETEECLNCLEDNKNMQQQILKLKQKIQQRDNEHREKLQRLSDEMPEILRKVKLLQKKCQRNDQEMEHLKKENKELNSKKKKYKDHCRFLSSMYMVKSNYDDDESKQPRELNQ